MVVLRKSTAGASMEKVESGEPEWAESEAEASPHTEDGKVGILRERAKRLIHCQYLVISAGGANGIAFCSAIEALRSIYAHVTNGADLFASLKGVAGTSIGSIIALAICCQISNVALKAVITDPKTWDFVQFLQAMDPARFWKERGFCDHDVLYTHIDWVMGLLGLPPRITFAELYSMTSKEFICNASCWEDQSILYMSRHTTPYMEVRKALGMSMCVPIYIRPFTYNNKEYIDGGVLKNFIMDVFPEECTIGISLDPYSLGVMRHCPMGLPEENGLVWMAGFISSLCGRINIANWEALSEERKRSTICMYLPGHENVSISATPAQIRALWKYGKASVMWYFLGVHMVSWMLWEEVRKRLECCAIENAQPGMV